MIEGQIEDSIIGRGTDIAEGAKVTGSLIFPSNIIKSNAEVSYAILDKNIVVEEGVKIIGTPEKPIVVKKGTHVTADIIGG